MKKFVLNALNILGWIGEIFSILMIVLIAIESTIVAFAAHNPEIRREMSAGAMSAVKEMGVDPHIIQIFIAMVVLGFIDFFVIFFLIRYARLLVKNLKNEIYFAKENMALLKKLLISMVIYVVLEIIGLGLVTYMSPMVKNVKINSFVNPTPVFTAILFLAIFYIVYLVFKYGMQLQEDSNSII